MSDYNLDDEAELYYALQYEDQMEQDGSQAGVGCLIVLTAFLISMAVGMGIAFLILR